jgi:hypothetical protein
VLTCVSLFYNLIEFLAKEKLELWKTQML